jgi:hypothetical protein
LNVPIAAGLVSAISVVLPASGGGDIAAPAASGPLVFILADPQKVVTPVKTGVQNIFNHLKRLDSGLRRNDRNDLFRLFTAASYMDR